jgi:hypothetical protein
MHLVYKADINRSFLVNNNSFNYHYHHPHNPLCAPSSTPPNSLTYLSQRKVITITPYNIVAHSFLFYTVRHKLLHTMAQARIICTSMVQKRTRSWWKERVILVCLGSARRVGSEIYTVEDHRRGQRSSSCGRVKQFGRRGK